VTGIEITIGSRWRHGNHVYNIRAKRPIEPGCAAWGAHQLVLAVPEGGHPHPLDWIPDTWLRRVFQLVEDLTEAV
jgi:hypothetical protein